MLLSPVWVGDEPSPLGFSLALLGVLPDHEGKGIGTALVRHALQVSRREGRNVVVALGFPDYCRRFGFALASEFGLGAACALGKRSFMAIELEAGALSNRTGMVRYMPAFDRL